MNPLIHRRILGCVALAAAPALAAAEGIAPWGWPLPYGQQHEPYTLLGEAAVGQLTVSPPPW